MFFGRDENAPSQVSVAHERPEPRRFSPMNGSWGLEKAEDWKRQRRPGIAWRNKSPRGERKSEKSQRTRLEEWDVIKTTSHFTPPLSYTSQPGYHSSSAFLAFFFLNWVYPNWYPVSFHPYQQLPVSKRSNGQNVIFPQLNGEWNFHPARNNGSLRSTTLNKN